VQNSIEVKNLGVATSAVTFFRSLGGTIGVSVLGSILGTLIADHIKTGIVKLAPADQAAAAQALGSGTIPHVADLPDKIRVLVESAYGSGIGSVFSYSVPLAVLTLLAVIFLPNAKLGTKNAVQLRGARTGAIDTAAVADQRKREREDAEDAAITASTATAALSAVGQAHPTGSIEVIDVDANAAQARR
jgi:hypothetical protein